MVCTSCFFFSSRRRHTRCALVTGVQTCALPIYWTGTDEALPFSYKGIGGIPMLHLTEPNSNLLARTRRIAGQVGAVERALIADKDCADILHLVAAVRDRKRVVLGKRVSVRVDLGGPLVM